MAETGTIQGKNVELLALMGDEYVPFACATTIEVTISAELVPATTVTSGSYRAFRPRFNEWGLSLSTVSHIKATGKYTVFHTLLGQIRKEGLYIQAIFESNEGDLQVLRGHVYPVETTITGAPEGFSMGDMEFKGNGELLLSSELITPDTNNYEVKKYDYTATGGEMSISDSLLIARTIVGFFRDGSEREVITAGTPNDKQVKYLAGSGTFVFPFDLGATEHILIQYK